METDTTPSELKNLVRAGVHVGHRPSRRHPKMRPFIFGIKGTVEIIDVRKTAEALVKAKEIVQRVAQEGKTILFVGTKPHMRALVQEVATSCEMPYVVRRWLGGTITNFGVISKRLAAFRELEEMLSVPGKLDKYKKAEQVRLRRKFERMREELEGIKTLRQYPDLVLIASLNSDPLPAREARQRNIPTIGIVDSNTDPSGIDLPIPGNDDALSSLRYLLEELAGAVREGRKKMAQKSEV